MSAIGKFIPTSGAECRITSDDRGEELFAHFKSIQGDGFETLHEGQKVEFQITHGPRGRHADLIRPMLGK